MSAKNNIGMLFIAFFVVSTVTGCDMISPKKKAAGVPAVKSQAAAVKAAPAAADEKLPADIVVKVGDWTLTTAELNERVANVKKVVPKFDEKSQESKAMLVDELIRQRLLVNEARGQQLDQTKEFKAAVVDFENNILVQELVAGLTKDIKVTEAEAKEYFDKNPDTFIKPVEKKILEIQVATEAEAKDIAVQVLQGGDFAQIAKERSKSKTAATGGDLGFLTEAPFEQMQKTIAALSKGGVSSVFQGPDGYYIVKIDDIRGGEKLVFADIKDDLIKGLTGQKQQQVVMDKLADAAKKTNVVVNKEMFGKKTGE